MSKEYPSYILHTLHLLDPKDIIIHRDKRQRKFFTTDDLEASIAEKGILSPLIVFRNEKNFIELVMGERRLTTALKLELPKVPALFTTRKLTTLELYELEFEENDKRQDISWQEKVDAVLFIHRGHLESNPEHTKAQTAAILGYSSEAMYMMISVAEAIEEGNHRLTEAPSYRNAYSILSSQREKQQENALAELDADIAEINAPTEVPVAPIPEVYDRPEAEVREAAPTPPRIVFAPHPEAPIINADFFEFAAAYRGVPFNFGHFDFPYGINLQDSDQTQETSVHDSYQDDPDLYWRLCQALVDNLNTLFSTSAHFIFWHAWKFHSTTRAFFEQVPSLVVQDVPLIWHKTDNKGIVADALRRPRNVTEVALFISRGDRKIIKPVSNAYGAPTSKVIHQSEKSRPMLQHFFSMVVDENTRMLDPTSGSGNALIAASELNAASVTGIEKDQSFYDLSVRAWKKYQTLKNLAKDK